MIRAISVLLALSVCGLSGCGSDADEPGGGGAGGASGGSGGTSGGAGGGGGDVPPNDAVLSTLTDAQLTALCEANRTSLEAVTDSFCLVSTLAAVSEEGGDEAACTEGVTACEDALGEDGTLQIDCSDPSSVVDYSDCGATVGDLLDCGPQVASYIDGLSCSDVGAVPDIPPCAAELETQCPNVYQF